MNTIFKKFTEKLNNLEKTVQSCEEKIVKLETICENLQQNAKSKNICMFGVPEETNEKTSVLVLKTLNDKMNLQVSKEGINNCFRIGKNTNSQKTRPIIVSFANDYQRNIVIKNRRSLKGSGIFISEDLIKSRQALFREARSKVDKKCVYTSEGNIFVIRDNVKYKIRSSAELQNIT